MHNVNPLDARELTRRYFLQKSGVGLGACALSTLFQQDSQARGNQSPLAVKSPHFPARAKSVIYIHLVGAPSHLDLFDYKPELQKRSGQLCPDEFFVGKKLAFIREQPKLLGTPKDAQYEYQKCGESGLDISNLMPHLQTVADEMTVIKTITTDQFNHAPAQLHLLTGFGRFGRPSIGSWVTYGLGSENQNLPGFVVLITGNIVGAGSSAWGSGFVPSVYQGVEFRSQGDPVLFLSNPKGVPVESRKRIIDSVNQLNQVQFADISDPEIETRISQYEMAYRMQTSVPDLMDINGETKQIHEMYGTEPGKTSFANNCLLARRLVQRGVRFVQLFDSGWDMHNGVFKLLPKKCGEIDRPIAALIKDLKQQGMLDDTLVVWSSEFGRTPMAQGKNGLGKVSTAGRDHHKEGFALWMAGGGIKGGFSYGKTDELGYAPVENQVDVHDFNATILHLLGMNHERLSFKYQGRPYRLTDIFGNVIKDVIA